MSVLARAFCWAMKRLSFCISMESFSHSRMMRIESPSILPDTRLVSPPVIGPLMTVTPETKSLQITGAEPHVPVGTE